MGRSGIVFCSVGSRSIGVLPDLVGIRAQVDLGIRVSVENPSFLGEQVPDHVIVTVVLEKELVGTDNLGVLRAGVA